MNLLTPIEMDKAQAMTDCAMAWMPYIGITTLPPEFESNLNLGFQFMVAPLYVKVEVLDAIQGG